MDNRADSAKRMTFPELDSGTFLDGQACFHPSLLTFGIMSDVGVTLCRQFTGGIFAGVSMKAGAIGHDLCGFVGQH